MKYKIYYKIYIMAVRIDDKLYQMYDISRYFKDVLTLAHFVDDTYDKLQYVQCPDFDKGYYKIPRFILKTRKGKNKLYLYPELDTKTNSITMKGGIFTDKNVKLDSLDGWDGLCNHGCTAIALETEYTRNKKKGTLLLGKNSKIIVVDSFVYDCREETGLPKALHDYSMHHTDVLQPDIAADINSQTMLGCDKDTPPQRVMRCGDPVIVNKEEFKKIIEESVNKEQVKTIIEENEEDDDPPPEYTLGDYTPGGGKSRRIRKSRRKNIRKSKRSKKNRKTRKNYK